jgi:hypothetical protein
MHIFIKYCYNLYQKILELNKKLVMRQLNIHK